MKKPSLVNLSVLLVSFLSCAFLLEVASRLLFEVASRLLFEVPPSVVIENRSDPDATTRPLQERKNEYFAKAEADLLLCEVIWG